MLEKIVHWLIFISIASFVLTAIYELLTDGEVSEPCCTLSWLVDGLSRPAAS
jgi:hypothetical protein